MLKQSALLISTLLLAGPVLEARQPAQQQQRPAAPQSVEDRTAGLKKLDGYFPLYWDERTGGMFLEISRFDTDFLFSSGLSAGLGSNDIGLDRGSGRGGGRLVQFQRVGPRVFLVQPNQSFRSSSKNPLERKSVEDSFAKSILWGFAVAAESSGRVLVDATDFFLRDVVNAASSLRPGNYRVDRTRSAFYLPNTRNFPKNTEVDMTLTFVNEQTGGGGGGGGGPTQGPAPIGATGGGGGGGGFGGGLFSGSVGSVTPSPEAVTMREHVSFVELPDITGYTPRLDDPRAGYGGATFVDFSQPIAESIQFRYIRRHRLQKKDPGAAMSEPIKPIQYWVDSGAPEDVKKALVEGAMWWDKAFEAAGFRNAFKVDILPDGRRSDGHPLQHDQLGPSLDARLELGRLGLGSAHRRDHQGHRHARLAARPPGLHDLRRVCSRPTPTAPSGRRCCTRPRWQRIRQLSAHEVGHTLGLGHNYYDSSKGWISVMDYPTALAELKADGTIDLSKAYHQNIGEWDKIAINWGYREFPNRGNDEAALDKIIADAWTGGLTATTRTRTSTFIRRPISGPTAPTRPTS